MIWHMRSVVVLDWCWSLAENDIAVTPSVMFMDYVSDIIMWLIWFPLLQHFLLT